MPSFKIDVDDLLDAGQDSPGVAMRILTAVRAMTDELNAVLPGYETRLIYLDTASYLEFVMTDPWEWAAGDRIKNTPELQEVQHLIYAKIRDPQSKINFRWIATAEVTEIIKWVYWVHPDQTPNATKK